MNLSDAQFVPEKPVLIVDDDPPMRTGLELSFRQRGWAVESASGKADALLRLGARKHALVVSDVRMRDGNGFDVLRATKEVSPGTAVILLTAFGAVHEAVEAMKSGACEYLTKPIAFNALLDTAARILASNRAERGTDTEMIGSSSELLRALERARLAAASHADILIEAESGTGKELLARRIHGLSDRSAGPLVAVNCAALPEALLESELFGHARGAFTGALTSQPGKFQLANGGSLLLDEIGEMPLNLQPKLLRVLQEREVCPLGETMAIKLDIRVIATTNRSLLEMVRSGRFRTDLYHRLNVIALDLPALRERRGDIRLLAQYFLERYSPLCRGISENFIVKLERHDWPGNVRELANAVRRAVVLGEAEAGIPYRTAESDRENGPLRFESFSEAENFSDRISELKPGMSLQSVERRLLELTLNATCGNRSRAAEMLGISLRTVRNKVREYNLPSRRDYFHD